MSTGFDIAQVREALRRYAHQCKCLDEATGSRLSDFAMQANEAYSRVADALDDRIQEERYE